MLIYGHFNYLGTKQHGKSSSCQERLGLPPTCTQQWAAVPSQISAWDNLLREGSSVQGLVCTDHHLEGKALEPVLLVLFP